MDAYSVGVAAWRLGAGRARKEDPVQAGAGIRCLAKPGEFVEADQPLFELHTDTPAAVPTALEALNGAYTVTTTGTRDERATAEELDGIVLETIRP